MRTTARWAATIALAATAVGWPLTAAVAQPAPAPASLYAPSALVLTVGHGESSADTTVERAVTLACEPTAAGTHPDAEGACGQLRQSRGDFDRLPENTAGICTREYNPVVVTAEGVWQGKRVSYERVYANDCVRKSQGSRVFSF
ncbi:subtilase-type protease inhibitor [Streptomyces purpureus]|uniref:Probable subtilase-type protease inhibitor n=1 Tax=Streptomyces purpureus TaxID=1951 RepID=A0A918HE01_9ACTN|nr:subtilase-type protease inhibitor [Streptomyces purpureus]GGT53934.1 subtilase-type protease inhibitor [Streptomyces purpureus]